MTGTMIGIISRDIVLIVQDVKTSRTIMAKTKQSELQKAADRVRQMQEAVESMEANMQVCLREYEKYDLLRDEASRNLDDTRALLGAQRDKLHREIQSVRKLVGYNTWDVGAKALSEEACAKRSY